MSSIRGQKSYLGTFAPPGLPFSASDDEKIRAKVSSFVSDGGTIDMSMYSDAHEVVKFHVDLFTDARPPTGAVMTWFNDDTNKILYQLRLSANSETGFLNASADSWMESWIGIKPGEIDRPGNYAVAFVTEGESESTRQSYVLHFQVVKGQSGPGPTLPPGEQFHEIVIKYREGLFGVADRLAQKSPGLIAKIADLLPGNFSVQSVEANTSENTITIKINEQGNNVIPVLAVVAIVAVVVAVIAVFYLGYTYKENAILKATGQAHMAAIDEIDRVIINPELTDEQRIEKIKSLLNRIPSVVFPDDKGGGLFDNIGEIVKWGAIALIALGALQAFGGMRRR